ncbi:MAG: hypothetical protein HY271_18020 [Deltaproteobacteria bacterium]|nr:hypothetical protein [Deltaproteobacteria bacterium]
MRWIVAIAIAAGFVLVVPITTGHARNLQRTLGRPVESQGGVAAGIVTALRPLGSVIGSQVANQIPSLSTSAGFTYEFNPDLDVYERSTKTFGPLFSERAVTVGAHKFNANVSYTYIKFDSINGHDLDHLTSRVLLANIGNQRAFAGGLRRPDLASQFPDLTPGTTFSQVKADLDLEAQLVDFSFMYGVLDDLDVNIDIPVVRTFVRSAITERTLDPRFAVFLTPASRPDIFDDFAARGSALGVGNIRLRSKYVAVTNPVRLAGLLDLVLPTGSPGNFQGTGDTRLGTFLIASQTVGEIFEPHAQAGVEFNCANVDHSQAKYSAGVTTQVASFAALTLDFLGRSEFAATTHVPSSARFPASKDGQFTETVPPFHGEPILVSIHRNDILDLAVGGKFSITPQAIFFATVILPLNDDGLRADFVPTVGLEATF